MAVRQPSRGKYTTTLGPAYNEFGSNEHPIVTSRYLCIKIIDCNVKMFGYNEYPLITSSFFCIFLLVANGTPCIYGQYQTSFMCVAYLPVLEFRASSGLSSELMLNEFRVVDRVLCGFITAIAVSACK